MKILIVWDRMGDYHRSRVDTYRAMYVNDLLCTADLSGADNLYKWKNTAHNKHFVLSNKQAGQVDLWQRFKKFKQIVKTHQIDKVVLSGYGSTTYLLFTIWLKLKGKNTYMFAESWYPGKAFVDGMKGLFLKCFVKGVFASGKRAEAHFTKRLNYPKHQIRTGYSVVDNAHFNFERSLSEVTKALDYKPILLCVARYAEEKNLALLIAAFENSELSSKWQLQLVGGGPLKDALQHKIVDPAKVQLLNWQSYEDLPLLYQKASCFILPSKFEPWGLVVNEAMAAALPIILSDECGCLPDLLCDNGYAFTADIVEELVMVLDNLNAKSALELHTMGQKSKKIILKYSPFSWAENLNKLIE